MMTKKSSVSAENTKGGFTALIAVVLLASGTLAFAVADVSAALLYADAVAQRESRIQAGLYAESCARSVVLMMSKDHFLAGNVTLADFGCSADVTHDLGGHYTIRATAVYNGITSIFILSS